MSTTSFLSQVFKFNTQVVGVRPPVNPEILKSEESDWLYSAFVEEGAEFNEGKGDLVAQVDACIDLTVFAMGGLVRMGLTQSQIEQCLHAVMNANLQKKAGVKEGRTGAPDAIKPEDWTPPEDTIREILKNG